MTPNFQVFSIILDLSPCPDSIAKAVLSSLEAHLSAVVSSFYCYSKDLVVCWVLQMIPSTAKLRFIASEFDIC